MKPSATVLALLILGTQSVIAADCCCTIICRHPSEVCSDCAHKDGAAHDAAKECCKKNLETGSSSMPQKRCAHLEPSSEILILAAEACTAPPALVLETPVLFVPAPPEACKPAGQACTARGSPPLHLLCSVLLI